ncbi:hypothetical protein ONZ45_g8847 [Pleurotus djamor]|nr:hypothetical protein ONZ45_g8847 [Pleurotus djamor]
MLNAVPSRILVAAIWVLGYAASNIPPFEREFDRKDPLISHHHKHNQISGWLNNVIALWVPISAVVVVNMLRRSLIDIHHAAISLMASRGFTHLLTEFLKNKVGRLRPDFLARSNPTPKGP